MSTTLREAVQTDLWRDPRTCHLFCPHPLCMSICIFLVDLDHAAFSKVPQHPMPYVARWSSWLGMPHRT
jgi:hypothetical protein